MAWNQNKGQRKVQDSRGSCDRPGPYDRPAIDDVGTDVSKGYGGSGSGRGKAAGKDAGEDAGQAKADKGKAKHAGKDAGKNAGKNAGKDAGKARLDITCDGSPLSVLGRDFFSSVIIGSVYIGKGCISSKGSHEGGGAGGSNGMGGGARYEDEDNGGGVKYEDNGNGGGSSGSDGYVGKTEPEAEP